MRVLFVVLPERGHIHPMLGPAAELMRRGHTVAFHAPRDVSAQLGRLGFEQIHADEVPRPAEDNRGAALAELVRDGPRLRRWIRGLLLGGVSGEVVRLERALASFGPDVIAADPMAYQAPIAAARAGLPWAGLSSSLNPVVPEEMTSELMATARELAAERDELFARHGLRARFRVVDCLSPHLNVVFSTEALVGPPPVDVELVGPSLPLGRRGDEVDFPWARLREDVPVIYASLGSQLFHQPRIFATLLAAVADEPCQLVLSAGDLADALPLPSHAIAVPYAPQLALLARSAVLVTHGGANSVMEALHFGVPLLVTPLCNDQFHNAEFVERSGAGLRLDLERATPGECRQALRALLGAGPQRQAAGRIADSYRRQDGAARAAALIEGLVRPAHDVH
ncbi:MAG TPA: nucleotide disphospho-sugar-binding domain-containing protein [Polyangia bacterium]|nr:nucleotide disphospho-sugar-binding domain-containing protein [Polyangia bacterium]